MDKPNGQRIDQMFEADFFQKLFGALDNNTVLRVKTEEGDYVPIYCSREFAEMMECTQEEFLETEKKAPLSTVFPEDREEAAFLLERGRARDGRNHVVVRKQTMKGSLIWVDLHYAFFQSGGKEYAYCNYFDITQLKESERRTYAMYKELDQELQALADDSLSTIRSNLDEGVVEQISGKDLYDGDKPGAKMEDLLQVRLQHMPNPADRKRYLEHFNLERMQQAYEKGVEVEPLVIFTRRQSGKQCFVQYSAGMRKDPVTGKTTVFGVETEYNDQKVNEVLDQKILARQYDMISYVVNGTYGVVIGDPKSIKKGSIFPKEMNGNYMDYIESQVIPVASEEHHDREQLRQALTPETIEVALQRQSDYAVDVTCEIGGEIFYKRFAYYVVDRAAKFYILLKSDFTEVQREQLRRNEQLKNALEEARQANVAKTFFLSNMSHEIRTPMNAIIGLNSIALKEEDLPDKTRKHLEQIGASARHLLGLINDILDMSRIESGRMVLRNEEFSFREMIEQINTMISGQCRDKGLEYDCVFKDRLEDYYIGDDTKLKQVLINILGNAVKFTPAPGSIHFSVEQTARYEDKSTLRFTIRDTGIGMDEEYLPKLFEVFTQENATRTSQYGGTGLGMAITKNIVEMMNGEITVESTKGKGSTFIVSVTLGNSARTGRPMGEVHPADLDVLVIDDDPVACEHACIVLEEIGVACDTALSGTEALDMIRIRHARRQPYNLILVDLHMPEQDGIEVTRRIRKIIGPETAVIILTAYSWDDVMEDAILAGVDSFLAKPLFSGTAMAEFSQAIRQKAERAEAAHQEADLTGKRVLLAEDVMINAEIMKEILQMWGMEVDVAENGQIALDLFCAQPASYYDAVLMDVRMPVMDGLAASVAIRASGRADSETVPIIAMTANAFDEDVQRSLQAGMNAHLSKPVEPDRLFETLGSLIGRG